MASRVNFALEMKDGALVRDLQSLQENFDIEKVEGYFLNGMLLTWLRDRYYEKEAEKVAELSRDDQELKAKLCTIFGVEHCELSGADKDNAENERKQERILRLKGYTYEEDILVQIDRVAFNQEELALLLDKGICEIYLCEGKFTIPLSQQGKEYIGIGKVEAEIRSVEVVDFLAKEISFSNMLFDARYQEILKTDPILLKGKEFEVAEKYEEAMRSYKQAADVGNTIAMVCLGDLYYEGKGGETDYTQAHTWYTKAANLCNTIGMYKAGKLYELPKGVGRDYELAYDWFEMAANLGDEDAESALQEFHEDVISDYDEIEGYEKREVYACYKEATDLDDPDAMQELGDIYSELGDDNLAEEWWEKASEAMYEMGEKYYCGESTEEDLKQAYKWYDKAIECGNKYNQDILAKVGDRYYNAEHYTKAFECYQKAAEIWKENDWDCCNNEGYSDVMNTLGDMYCDGKGVAEDHEKAFECYKEAAQIHYSCGYATPYYAAAMYRRGNQFEYSKDYHMAYKCYIEAAGSGDIMSYGPDYSNEAFYELGDFYDDEEGYVLYKEASDGDIDAIYELGEYYEGLEKFGDACGWYETAVEKGDDDAILKLAECYRKWKIFTKACEWYKKAIEKGNNDVMLELADCYEEAGHFVEACRWYEKAAETEMVDHAYSMLKLGDIYSRGWVEKSDFAKGLNWYEKAAEAGNDEAMYKLGKMYYCGEGGIADYAKAYEWYEKAAGNGNAEAIIELGKMYENGIGVAKDYDKAHEWYEKGADGGNSDAMYELGRFYEECKEDYEKAYDWYLKAATVDAKAHNWYSKAVMIDIIKFDLPRYRYKDETEVTEGSVNAMCKLGDMYHFGIVVEKDDREARAWYKKAAKAEKYGSLKAIEQINRMYGEEAYPTTMYKYEYWIRREKGQLSADDAMFILGELYRSGGRVEQDIYKAREWYEKAAELGNEHAKKRLREIMPES